MTISELIQKLQWWEGLFGDLPVELRVMTNAPIVSRGGIIDSFLSKRGKGKKLIIFGGNKNV